MDTKTMRALKPLISAFAQDLKQLKAAFIALKAFSGVKHGAANGEAVALSYREFTGAITIMRQRLDRIAHVSGMLPSEVAASTINGGVIEVDNDHAVDDDHVVGNK